MFKYLHPLERWGFFIVLGSVVVLLLSPFYLKDNPTLGLISLLPVFTALTGAGMLLVGQQRRLRVQKKQLDEIAESLDSSTSALKQAAEALKRASASSKKALDQTNTDKR